MNVVSLITEQLRMLAESAIQHLPNVAAAAALIFLTWIAARLARRLTAKFLPKGGGRRSLALAIRKLITIGVWTLGLALATIVLFPSVKPSNLIAGLGLGSVAIGFAFKDIFENFFAGMLILFRQPFQINDHIEVNGIEGIVEDITIRDTLVRQTDGQPVIVPNSVLFKNPVTVRTDRDKRRVTVMCGVAYDEDVDAAREVIERALQKVDSVDTDEPVQVLAQSFGASSIDFEVTWWTGSKPVDVRKSRDAVVAQVKSALDEAGIEIPYPYQTLTFHEPLPVRQIAANS